MRKLRAGALLAAIVAIASIPVALATGATPAPPTVATAAPSNVSASGATLNGSVNPNGQQNSYAFQWGPTAGYGHETPLSTAGAGGSTSAVSAALSGLSSGSAYHYRILAMNGSGTSVGADQTFTTAGTAPTPSTPPTASTGSPTSVGQSGATVNGTVNPGGQATSYYFEYGPTSNYGFETAAASAGSGLTAQGVSTALSGLGSSTTYHYRLVAVSPGGTALGGDQTLRTTTPPTVSTGGASRVHTSSATLNGTVNPQAQASTYYFQYGPTISYGLQSRPASAGSGSGNVAVNAYIAGLQPTTLYHYRVVAQSAGGTSDGADRTFETGGSQTPSHVQFMGRMGFVSPGAIIGVEAGCFGGQTSCGGHITMSHNNTVIGQRNFNIAPETGGFQNIGLNYQGKQLLRGNGVFHLLSVDVLVSTTRGQKTSQVMHLARWVWH